MEILATDSNWSKGTEDGVLVVEKLKLYRCYTEVVRLVQNISFTNAGKQYKYSFTISNSGSDVFKWKKLGLKVFWWWRIY